MINFEIYECADSKNALQGDKRIAMVFNGDWMTTSRWDVHPKTMSDKMKKDIIEAAKDVINFIEGV